MLQNSTFQFLKALAKNNNREWFALHKPTYEIAKLEVIAFAEKIFQAFEGGTNVNTVVDNSVRQVSSPITTFVMKDDKVRDFHPILRNTERSSLRAYTLAMR